MDGEEDYSANAGENTTKTQDQNDMTFCINSYLKDAMKVRTNANETLSLKLTDAVARLDIKFPNLIMSR
jgi:hypothetical protein